MIAVHSLWSNGGNLNAISQRHAALIHLSLHYAQKQFQHVVLVTDKKGAELMRDIGAEYGEVFMGLDGLRASHIWALGKMAAYKFASEKIGPFCHIDFDVFLTKPLPERLLSARIFAEREEVWSKAAPSWRHKHYDLKHTGNLWAHRSKATIQRAYCCGIFGGNDTAKIASYAERSLLLANNGGWGAIHGTLASVLLEQYALADFAPITTLFPAYPADAQVSEAGYIHMQGIAKCNSSNMAKVFALLQREAPDRADTVNALR